MTKPTNTVQWSAFSPGSDKGYRVTVASDWAPIWSYESVMRQSASDVYGDLLPILRGSDLNVVNVECVIGNAGAPISKPGPCLRGDWDIAIPALQVVPFHVATLANNHAMDYGPDSLDMTLEVLKEAGVATVGAGMDGTAAAQPLIIQRGKDEAPIAIINFGEGEACASLAGRPGVNVYDLEIQEDQIRELKQKGHLVIAIFHGGRELAVMPPPYVVKGLRRLAKAGADAIVGHHPHVPQAMEIYHGVPIAYSQGNFVFRRENPAYYQSIGYLVHFDILADRIAAASFTPYKMQEAGVFALQGEEKERFLKDLKVLSGYLQHPEKVESLWHAFVDGAGYYHDELKKNIDAEGAIMGQISSALELYKKDPAKAIAYFHHYFFAPAHREYLHTAFTRLKLKTLGDAPDWAKEWVKKWKH